jgi:deoxyribodipyrimidine photo-lyase
MTIDTGTTEFMPTDDAWIGRLNGLDPRAYAATRNHLNGAVSGLSPYFTHGFLSIKEAVDSIRKRTTLGVEEKLFAEFSWRLFFHHAWSFQGEAIFNDLRPALQGVRYKNQLPADIRQGRTGLSAIDKAIATLYSTGYLHNHARMWLASYVVHLRHVHWRAGADWLYGHLLDGDLASNHLSWQWVAGTFSSKPYLFNADNVDKYAPVSWSCKKTPLDTTYEHLESMARGHDETGRCQFETLTQRPDLQSCALEEPKLYQAPPSRLSDCFDLSFSKESMQVLHGSQAIELVHAWSLRKISLVNPQPNRKFSRLGVIHLPSHVDFPWSERRWAFVLERMHEICDALFIGDLKDLSPLLPDHAQIYSDRAVGNHQTLTALAALGPIWMHTPTLHEEPSEFCGSFSKYFRAVSGVKKKSRPLHR